MNFVISSSLTSTSDLCVTFATGESSTQVSPYLPGGVSDGNWHTVHIHYYNKVRKCSEEAEFSFLGGLFL